jgi:hypothetical protein
MMLRTLLLWAIYAGLGTMAVKAALERREAARLWRDAVGGPYDFKQKRFAVELELDRAVLPDKARRMLLLARRDMGFVLLLLPVALTIQTITLGE